MRFMENWDDTAPPITTAPSNVCGDQVFDVANFLMISPQFPLLYAPGQSCNYFVVKSSQVIQWTTWWIIQLIVNHFHNFSRMFASCNWNWRCSRCPANPTTAKAISCRRRDQRGCAESSPAKPVNISASIFNSNSNFIFNYRQQLFLFSHGGNMLMRIPFPRNGIGMTVWVISLICIIWL